LLPPDRSPFPLQLPPHHLDLLQHLFVGQQSLPHQHAPQGLLLVQAGAEEFLDGGYLAGIGCRPCTTPPGSHIWPRQWIMDDVTTACHDLLLKV